MMPRTITIGPNSTAASYNFSNFTFARTPKMMIKSNRQDEAARLVCDADHTCFMEAKRPLSEAFRTMLASEDVLRREWDTPEEDEAWANL